MEYVDLSDDATVCDPDCDRCDGSGWIWDREDNASPCPTWEAMQDALQAACDAEIDALYVYQADCAASEAREALRARETAGLPF